MIFYFTGSGNSMWVARRLGKALQQEVKNIEDYSKDKEINIFDDFVGFVFPTYINDLPWYAKEFVLKLRIPSFSYCFVVMTSSRGKSGKAFNHLDQALFSHGVKLAAGFNLQMPGNCIESSQEENKERLRLAPRYLDAIREGIQNRIINYKSRHRSAGKNFVNRSYFYGTHSICRLTFMKKFLVTEQCDGCGICAKLCPLNNITIRDGLAIHGDDCAACYRCVHWCPRHATLPDVLKLKHRSQYTHPEITVEDMIQSKKS